MHQVKSHPCARCTHQRQQQIDEQQPPALSAQVALKHSAEQNQLSGRLPPMCMRPLKVLRAENTHIIAHHLRGWLSTEVHTAWVFKVGFLICWAWELPCTLKITSYISKLDALSCSTILTDSALITQLRTEAQVDSEYKAVLISALEGDLPDLSEKDGLMWYTPGCEAQPHLFVPAGNYEKN